MRIKSPKGFTLLELVVVIAIIGLLASIALIPNLIRFQQRAAASRMKAAVTQIATAYELASTEGCTSMTITVGGTSVCTAPSITYITAIAANPATGPRIDLTGGDAALCNDATITGTLTQDPQTVVLDICVGRFLAGTGEFVCSQGSCACTVDGECVR